MTIKPVNLSQTKKQASIESQLAITAYGLKSVTGKHDFALFGVIASMLSAASEDNTKEVPSIEGDGYEPALLAAIPEFDGMSPELRMLQSLQDVIYDTTEYLLDKHLEDKQHLLLIVLPASNAIRSEFIDLNKWQALLSSGLTEFTDLHFRFINADDNVTKHLQTACSTLNEGKFDSLLFAGIDSLVDEVSYQKLINQNRLCSTSISEGVIPGEAAACVVIQKNPTPVKQVPPK